MSEENVTSTAKEKKKEIFGIPQDDATLYVAAGALGLAGLIGIKTVADMFQNGQIPNPFAPKKLNYNDLYAQQLQQRQYAQEYEQAQALEEQAQAQQQQQGQAQQQQGAAVDERGFGGNSIAASNELPFQGFDDNDDGVSYSTTVQPPRTAKARYDRVNVG